MSMPALRFNGFDEAWKLIEIGDVGEIITGSTPDTTKLDYYDGKKLFVSPADFNYGRFIRETKTKLTEIGFRQGRRVEANSVLFVCIGSTIGKVAQNSIECVTNQQINSIVTSCNHSSNFIYSRLEKDCQRISLLAGKQAVPIINKTTFSKVKIVVPTLPEQTKIANFLKSVDDKIMQLTQKCELLVQYKNGIMQQIFSQELRFKDDGQDFPEWELIELKKIATKVTNKNKKLSVRTVLTNSATQGVVSQADYFDRNIANQNNLEGYYIVEVDDFVYNPRISANAPVGPVKRNNLKTGVMSPLYTVFRFTIGCLDFFNHYFHTTHWHDYMKSVANSGARHDRMAISNENFFDLPVPFPCEQEQVKIANFLTAIDNKLTHTKNQLAAVKQYKQGLLQQMFV